MRYLPILEELCSSDSILFMVAGIIVAFKSRFRDTLSVLKSKRFFGTINHRSKERWRTPCVKFRLVPLRMW